MRYDIMFTHAAWHLIPLVFKEECVRLEGCKHLKSHFGVGFLGASADCTPVPAMFELDRK
jgi:hypothetical protein